MSRDSGNNMDNFNNDKRNEYEVGYKKPPKNTQFGAENGNPINRSGRRKVSKTLEEEVRDVFGMEKEVMINGKKVKTNLRKLAIMQIAINAAKGDQRSFKLAAPFLKMMDDVPELEIFQENDEAFKDFINLFNNDGDKKDE